MKLYINGCETKDVADSDEVIKDFVGRVSRTHVPAGQMISQVKVDDENMLWRGDDRQVSSCGCVEITTAPANEVLISGLLDAYHTCSSFQETLCAVADGLGTLQNQQALANLASSMETVQWLYTIVSGVERVLGISAAGSAVSAVHAPRTILTGIAGALEEENYVLVSDILRYELVPYIEELQKVLPALIKEADNKLLMLS